MNRRSRRLSRPSLREQMTLFVDRHAALREFLAALHDDPPSEQVLFFHGVGGSGKSLLLRYLRENGCRRLLPAQWQRLRAEPDSSFRMAFEAIAEDCPSHPVALLDFSGPPLSGNPTHAFDALLMLRRSLAAQDFSFPVFDFAIVLYAQRVGYRSDEIANLLPAAERGLVADLLGILVDESRIGQLANVAYDHLQRRFSQDAGLWWAKRKLSPALLRDLLRLDVETELAAELPFLLADDLSSGMAQRAESDPAARLCLFFDTHDAFWAEGGASGSLHELDGRDEWFRALLVGLDLSLIKVVVTGRDLPRWSSAVTAPLSCASVRTVPVGDLPVEDADLYLRQRKVELPDLRGKALSTLGTEHGVHPLFLGLVADAITSTSAQEAERGLDGLFLDGAEGFSSVGSTLLNHLLRYLTQDERVAVTAMSACRTFDEDLYVELGRALRFGATRAGFLRLTGFSFVVPVRAGGTLSWKVHTLLRRVLLERGDEDVMRAHEVLAEHYDRASAEDPGDRAFLERTFHRSCLPEQRDGAVEQWLLALGDARDDADQQRSLRLLALEDEVPLRHWHERASFAIAKAWSAATQGRPDDAAAVLSGPAGEPGGAGRCPSRHVLLRAELLLQLGWLHRYRTAFDDGCETFRQALQLVPGRPAAFAHMEGRLQFGLSGLYSDLGDPAACREIRAAAVASYERAIAQGDPPVRWVSDCSSGHSSLASTCLRLDEGQHALSSARRAVDLGTAALQREPDDVRASDNLQYAHFVLSQALDLAGERHAALTHATASLRLARGAHARRQDEVTLVRPLLQVARLHLALGTGAPRQLVAEAHSRAVEAVDRRPASRSVHLARALVCELQMTTASTGDTRRRAHDEACAALDAALTLAPGYLPAQKMRQRLSVQG